MVAVPRFVGMSLSEAERAIPHLNGEPLLMLNVETAPHDIAPSYVFHQDIPENTPVHVGQVVTVTISVGREIETFSMPDLRNMAQSAAEEMVRSLGLGVGTVHRVYHTTVPAGYVAFQGVAPGMQTHTGQLVSFTVSDGPPPDGEDGADLTTPGHTGGHGITPWQPGETPEPYVTPTPPPFIPPTPAPPVMPTPPPFTYGPQRRVFVIHEGLFLTAENSVAVILTINGDSANAHRVTVNRNQTPFEIEVSVALTDNITISINGRQGTLNPADLPLR